jgi:hypothetical protein
MSPIPSTLLSLFSGRLINLPEHTLKGRITTSGRCEFSVTLLGMVMLLFIEVKDTLKGGSAKHSDLVAQVLAEPTALISSTKSMSATGLEYTLS